MMNRFFNGYRKGDVCYPPKDGRLVKMVVRLFFKCRSGGSHLEDVLTDIFSSLPFPSGTANIPKNAMKNNDFYGAACSSFPESATEQ
jgi:hypothetical protein